MITRHSALPLGLLAVFTSVMIYHDTHRALWNVRRGALRFFGTTFSFAALSVSILKPSAFSLGMFAAVIIIKLLPEILFLTRYGEADWSPDSHSARLQLGPLRRIFIARMACAIAAIAFALIQPWLALPVLLLAEIFERQLFFQSVQAPKMPGNFGSPSFKR